MGFMSRGNTCLELLCIYGRRKRWVIHGRRAGLNTTLPPVMLRLGLPVSRLGSIGNGHRTFIRSYALSRFPRRGAPSGRRARPRAIAPRIGQGPKESEAQYNSSPDVLDKSSLWEESQRTPASNPEHGLTRLLQNDSLVVTRFVISFAYRVGLI